MIKHPDCTVMGHEDCDMCSGCDRLRQRDALLAETSTDSRTLIFHPDDVTIVCDDTTGRILGYACQCGGAR
jgi:hypothetical protein